MHIDNKYCVIHSVEGLAIRAAIEKFPVIFLTKNPKSVIIFLEARNAAP